MTAEGIRIPEGQRLQPMLAGIVVILPLLPAARAASILFAYRSAAVLAAVLLAEAVVCVVMLAARIHYRESYIQRKRAVDLAAAIRAEFS